MSFKHLISTAVLAAVSFGVSANTPSQTVIVPSCLLEQQSISHQLIAENKDFKLISATETNLDLLAFHSHQNVTPCGKFLDVTTEWQAAQNQKGFSAKSAADFLAQHTQAPVTKQLAEQSYAVKNQKVVNSLIEDIKIDSYWNYLTQLTDENEFPDRSASTDTGVKAANWLKDKVLSMAKEAGRDDVSARLVATGTQYKQPSVVVTIGTQGKTVPGVVVGAHMDTLTASSWPWDGAKPGADDDGTGSVTVLELARVLINSNQRFDKPVYLAWYAAEERGLVGSKYVVEDFKKQNIAVDNVLHLDMTGYQHQGDDQKLWLITDNVNQNLTNFLEEIALTYSGVTSVGRTSCGYACSDHASWTKGGFASAMPSETKFNEMNGDIHTSRDKMDNLSKSHMLKFAKMAVAFVGELAAPKA